MKTCPFCAAEIRDAVAFCDKCGRDLPASDSSAASAVLLAVTTWLTWTVRPAVKGSEQQSAETAARIVSPMHLMDIAPRLEVGATGTVPSGRAHQVIRFNVYNFGEQSVTLYAIALETVSGDRLRCEMVPRLVVGPGARYPLTVEVTTGPVVPENVTIDAENLAGQRRWLTAQFLPRP